jgi:hypothetical protein
MMSPLQNIFGDNEKMTEIDLILSLVTDFTPKPN